MMKSFLYNVAQDLLNKYGEDLHNVTVVFPNKRASLFLNRALAEISEKPIWSPQYTTISELFQQMSTLQVADRIKLICELHKTYCEVTGRAETLEQFYGWGEIMLADFDDIDKHNGDAKKIFTLLGDIHEMDAVDYLTEEQKRVLQRFFNNFTPDHTTQLKRNFMELWNKFYDIYTNYRQRLLAQGIAYEGMMYREVIECSAQCTVHSSQFNSSEYVFVGFNLLTPVEQLLIAKVEGKIYNDDDRSNPPKEMTFISSPTDDLQARYVSQWLTPERIKAGRRTAIVLADEGLLETVLHCLPTEMSLNITTGYPLSQTSITSLIKGVSNLLQRNSYTLHNINGILRHPLVKYISDRATELHEKLNNDLIYYLTPEEISIDENLSQLFMPLKNKSDMGELTKRLIWVTKTIAKRVQEINGITNYQLESEALYRMYTLLNRLDTLISEEEIKLDLPLYTMLLNQIIQGTTIPFHGEPIEGIQIMGVLETRNLDFDHVLLLSCNEGTLPAKVSDTSFLPHSIRMAYNLTTVENKVAIYQYYFDRLMQRTNDVTIIYNNSTNEGKTGEMSRFMLQMIAKNEITIKRKSLEASVSTHANLNGDIEKTQEMVDKLLKKKFISPSSLGRYLRCPRSFYYTYIEEIRDNEEGDEESMDNMTFGTIFHAAAEMMYKDFNGKIVSPSYIQRLVNEKDNTTLRRIAMLAFRRKLFNIKDEKRDTPKLGGLQVINFEMVVTFLRHLLNYDSRLTQLEIAGLEKEVQGSIPVKTSKGTIDVRIGGNIDRLDVVTDQDGVRRIRVIDYKTGRLSRKLNISSIDEIFMPEKMGLHTDYFLQALLYASILDDEREKSVGLLYVQSANNDDYDPLLCIDNKPIKDAAVYLSDFRKGLAELLAEILNTDIPFRQTLRTEQCKDCAFFNFCH
ncbi:MAG: PD-(D/E)XK nuclease family protein [Prevotella sp.]|nr:PD-(D/E)XK nuclease family protein [Prevotella sp.]